MTDNVIHVGSFSNMERKLYQFIYSRGVDVDVPIVDIYRHVYGDGADDHENRVAQQVIGAIISRTNPKISGAQIKPGELKRTYRLVPNSKA